MTIAGLLLFLILFGYGAAVIVVLYALLSDQEEDK